MAKIAGLFALLLLNGAATTGAQAAAAAEQDILQGKTYASSSALPPVAGSMPMRARSRAILVGTFPVVRQSSSKT